MASKATTLREAASKAYEGALAPIHTVVVRNVVRAGLLTLPSREVFLQHVNETGKLLRRLAVSPLMAGG